MNIDERPAPAAILLKHPNAKDRTVSCEYGEFLELAKGIPANAPYRSECSRTGDEWRGRENYGMSLDYARQGNEASVCKSDALLGEYEHIMPQSRGWQTSYDVVGGVASVPEYLAGNPCHMRRRKRTASSFAPLTICVNLGVSAGISTQTMMKRGIALLAITRLLANVRPTELWVGCSFGAHSIRASFWVRLETSPLDLARASYAITAPGFTRNLLYSCDHYYSAKGKIDTCLPWPYDDSQFSRKHDVDSIKPILAPNHDLFYSPGMLNSDKDQEDTKTWIMDKLSKYGGIELAA